MRNILASGCFNTKPLFFFAQRLDSLVIPPHKSNTELLQLDLNTAFQRRMLPLSVLGYGEGDVAHKIKLVLHAAKLSAGDGDGLERLRHSVRGMCSDQGWERELCDAPNVTNPDRVQQILADHRSGKNVLLASQPDGFSPIVFGCLGLCISYGTVSIRQ